MAGYNNRPKGRQERTERQVIKGTKAGCKRLTIKLEKTHKPTRNGTKAG
jgi:hypothetical protein